MSGFAENIELPVMYLKSLAIKNARSFKDSSKIIFTTENTVNSTQGAVFENNGDKAEILTLSGQLLKPSQWTVILGNNNTGKTTILKCIADLYLKTEKVSDEMAQNIYSGQKRLYYINTDKNKIELINDSEGHYFLNFLFRKSDLGWHFQRDFIWGILKGKDGSINFPASEAKETLFFKNIFLQGYSTQRKTSESSLSEQENTETVQSFFSNNFELINVEEWLLQINYASKNDYSPKSDRERAKSIEKRVREVITSEILPDIQDFRFRSTQDFKNYIEFQTDYGWIRLKDLGYGYQATLAWVMDLAKRMFDRYPTSKNPLAEPAVVLVDEIDLHLHPEWQRKIISYLSNIFKNTQFIVTAHSPLVVQSAENVNLVMLEKDGNHINIRQQFGSFKGWTVDEILDELMGMNDKTMSDTYLELMKNFDDALDEDNYEKAQVAYDGLDKILHPSSSQRKILRIQMSSLAPIEA